MIPVKRLSENAAAASHAEKNPELLIFSLCKENCLKDFLQHLYPARIHFVTRLETSLPLPVKFCYTTCQ